MEIDEKRTDNLAFILGVLSFFLIIFFSIVGMVLSCFALYFGIKCKNRLYRYLSISTFALSVFYLITLLFTH